MRNGTIYRQINNIYKNNYEQLIDSGLYQKLCERKQLLMHSERKEKPEPGYWKIIKPKQIRFISHPYEWCFSMLKDAALLTLSIQKTALEYNMSLKDASAFNIQFIEGKPILIDTLSFEKYKEGKPWVAYKQFVEHFLTALALMSFTDIRLNRLSSIFLDGIPVNLASRILPIKSRVNISLLIHIFAHASTQKKFENREINKKIKSHSFGKKSFLGMIENLEAAIYNLNWNPSGTQWAEYYDEENNNYKSQSLTHKATLTKKFLRSIKAKSVYDMGANTGFFSKIAAKTGASVIAFDNDYGALEKNYKDIGITGEKNVLPLFCDLTNPTPSVGWENKERSALFDRTGADAVLALALIHHLSISHNIPFSYLATCFSQLGRYLIIEFIDKRDSQVQKLLSNREDIFMDYTKETFEKVFKNHFKIKNSVVIKGSMRILYFMERR